MKPFANRRTFLGGIGAAGTAATWMAGTRSSSSAESHPSRRVPGKKIRIGQIGVGHAHASKLSVYRASDDYEVVGIAEPDLRLKNRAKSQAPYRDLKWMTVEQLLNVKDLDAVLVETRVRDSLKFAEQCVSAGKHIHLDKPAGSSFPLFQQIVETARKKRLLLQMGYMYRYNPAIILLRDFLKQGWLGEVFEVHTVMSKTINASGRKALAEYPGGLMFELGCHILDLVIGVLGTPKAVHSFNRHSSPLDDKLLDNMLAVLEYPKATATVKSSAQEVEGFARRHFVVCGDQGTFHIQPLDNPSAKIALAGKRGPYKTGYQDVRFPKYTRYVADAADMAKIIRMEKEADFTYEHDLAVQKTLLTACGLPLE